MPPDLLTHKQASAYSSPWTMGQRLKLLGWQLAWGLLCGWTPKPLNPWRLAVLRAFGAKLQGTPFVHARARIQQPWNLTMYHRACLGDRAVAYNLGPIILHEGCTIAQEAYLCTGTHDFTEEHLPLQTAPVEVGRDAFIGARAFILPGVTIGEGAIVGACSVVTRNVLSFAVAAGNPARTIGQRPKKSSPE